MFYFILFYAESVSWYISYRGPLYRNTYHIVRCPYRFTPITKFRKHSLIRFIVKTDYVFPYIHAFNILSAPPFFTQGKSKKYRGIFEEHSPVK